MRAHSDRSLDRFIPTPDRAVSRRFAAAVVLSALLHVLLSASVVPGSSSRAFMQRSGETPSLAARLIIPELTPPAPEAAPVALPETHIAVPRSVVSRSMSQPRRTKAPAAAAASVPAAAPGADIPDPTYYPARQLDVYPMLAARLDLAYTEAAAAADVNGHVLLLVMIDALGGVDDVSLVEAEPPGYFEDDARRAFLAARFNPAQKNGRAVNSRVLVNVTYGSADTR